MCSKIEADIIAEDGAVYWQQGLIALIEKSSSIDGKKPNMSVFYGKLDMERQGAVVHNGTDKYKR